MEIKLYEESQEFGFITDGVNSVMNYEDIYIDTRPTTQGSCEGQEIMFIDNNNNMSPEVAIADPYFMFTTSELDPEFAIAKATELNCKPFVDAAREARNAKKKEREEAGAKRATIRKERANNEKAAAKIMKRRSEVPDDMRFSRANVVSYDMPGHRPYECCGTFYVQPFSVIAPPKRVTRTEQQWRDAGLLPRKPGQPGFAMKQVRESEKRQLEIKQLLEVPVRTFQRKPRPNRWQSSNSPNSNASKASQYPSGPLYPSGAVGFDVATWDLPDVPAQTVDGTQLRKTAQFTKSGRMLLSGSVPNAPSRHLLSPVSRGGYSIPTTPSVPATLRSSSPAPKSDLRRVSMRAKGLSSLSVNDVDPHLTSTSPNEDGSLRRPSRGQSPPQDPIWKPFAFLPCCVEPPIGLRGDGTIPTDDAPKDTPLADFPFNNTDRPTLNKSEVTEAVARFRKTNEPTEMVVLDVGVELRKEKARRKKEAEDEAKSLADNLSADTDNEPAAAATVEHKPDDLKVGEDFAQLFAESQDNGVVMDEWSLTGGNELEGRTMSALANEDLPLVRRDHEVKPTSAALWRNSRGQPLPPHTPPHGSPGSSRGDINTISEVLGPVIMDELGQELEKQLDLCIVAKEMNSTTDPMLLSEVERIEEVGEEKGEELEIKEGIADTTGREAVLSKGSGRGGRSSSPSSGDDVYRDRSGKSSSSSFNNTGSRSGSKQCGHSRPRSRCGTGKSRPNTEEYMHEIYTTHIAQSGMFPHFLASTEEPSSPLSYEPRTGTEDVLVDPASEAAMKGLLNCGALPINVGATTSQLESLTRSERRDFFNKKKLAGDSSADGSGSQSSHRSLHRPVPITDSFKRELMKSGQHEKLFMKKMPS